MTKEEIKIKSLEIAAQFVSAEILRLGSLKDERHNNPAGLDRSQSLLNYAKDIEKTITDYLKD